jgi:hypothetical protein
MQNIAVRGATAADIAGPMREGQPFTCGKLSGYPGAQDYTGELPPALRDDYKGSRYTVLSYNTPIAWLGKDNKWVAPEHKYTSTTSKHQTLVRAALGLVN